MSTSKNNQFKAICDHGDLNAGWRDTADEAEQDRERHIHATGHVVKIKERQRWR